MVERPCWKRESVQVSGHWLNGLYMWTCLNCGNYVDAVIAFNRRTGPVEMRTRRHERHWEKIQRLVDAQRREEMG